ncbi:MAG: RNA polymerase sigma factor [Acidimicrobiia bacterium]
MSDERSDAEIIGASIEDPTEFGELFARHHRAVFRFVAQRVGVGDAADVAADVFVRAFSIRHRYDTERPDCLPWLYGIAANIIGDRLRRTKRRQRTYEAGVHVGLGADVSDVDDRLVAENVAGLLKAALDALPWRDRETLMLFALEEMTYSEIARVLDIPIGTVGSRIFRARRRILEEIPDLGQITGMDTPRASEDGS